MDIGPEDFGLEEMVDIDVGRRWSGTELIVFLAPDKPPFLEGPVKVHGGFEHVVYIADKSSSVAFRQQDFRQGNVGFPKRCPPAW